MNYKVILVVLVLIGVAGGIYYFQNNKKISEADMKATTELLKNDLTVVYNNEGFNPKEIRIKKGQTVKFVNQSDRKMWVASDNHPAHEIYPEFDQKEIAEKNKSYEFKFEKNGSWGYHNHLFAGHTGKIIVE